MSMFTIVMLEKNQNKRELLIHHLSKLKLEFKYNLIDFSNLEKMIEFCNDIKEHCIFIIDIEYEEEFNGIDVAKYINEHFSQNNIIFISEELEIVSEVYETEHCYYIHMPTLETYLEKAIIKGIRLYNKCHDFVLIDTGKSLLNIDVASITYIERIKRYSLIRYNQSIVRTHSNLNQLIDYLPLYFCKCHHSYLVNLEQVREKKRNEFVMNDGSVIPIARKYIKEMENCYREYLNQSLCNN